jgi:hypothetical protein
MRQSIRYGIAATVVVLGLGTTGGAQAGAWCGSTAHDKAVIECGYTTAARCESAVGKGGLCFVDPYTAMNAARALPAALKIFSRDTVQDPEQVGGRG